MPAISRWLSLNLKSFCQSRLFATREVERVEGRRVEILARVADRKAMTPVRAEIAFEIDAGVLLDHVGIALIECDFALTPVQRSG